MGLQEIGVKKSGESSWDEGAGDTGRAKYPAKNGASVLAGIEGWYSKLLPKGERHWHLPRRSQMASGCRRLICKGQRAGVL